ncbi:unnamed protein product [Tilletia caries]|nr:hypothetical protein CF335_g3018 [Tilletia laevis]CAD7064604.1 unnamed protein product [Tilletia caries]
MAENAAIFTQSDFYGFAIACSFFGCLIPTSLAYALFSTQRMRRLPIFWIQAVALALAFLYTCIELAYFRNVWRIRESDDPINSYWYEEGQAGAGFRLFVPLVSDIAVVMKVAAFYPHQVGLKSKRMLIIGFPSLLLVGRFITQAITWAAYKNIELPYLTSALAAEIALQVVGNCFCSILLLRRTFDLARNKHLTTHRAQRRLAHLIEALLMTFLPAIIVQITLLIVQFIDVAKTNSGAFSDEKEPTTFQIRIYRAEVYCQQANVIVSVLFGLLATLWSSIRTQSEGLIGPGTAGSLKSPGTLQDPAFAAAAAPGGGAGANANGAESGTGAVATFGGSSRRSGRSGTSAAAAGYRPTRDEDRPLLSFFIDARNPVDPSSHEGSSSAVESTMAPTSSNAAGLTPRHRATSSSSNRSWIPMDQKGGMGAGSSSGHLGVGSPAGLGLGRENYDMELASTDGTHTYREQHSKGL